MRIILHNDDIEDLLNEWLRNKSNAAWVLDQGEKEPFYFEDDCIKMYVSPAPEDK
jgi:hypothetical protein